MSFLGSLATVGLPGAVNRSGDVFFYRPVARLGVAPENLTGLGVSDPCLVRAALGFVKRARVGGVSCLA